MDGMDLYAVALEDGEPSVVWVEFYWADDYFHAEEQAKDANPNAYVHQVRMVPKNG